MGKWHGCCGPHPDRQKRLEAATKLAREGYFDKDPYATRLAMAITMLCELLHTTSPKNPDYERISTAHKLLQECWLY